MTSSHCPGPVTLTWLACPRGCATPATDVREVFSRAGDPVAAIARCPSCGARVRAFVTHARGRAEASVCGRRGVLLAGAVTEITCTACARQLLVQAGLAEAVDWRPGAALAEDFYAT